MMETARGNDNYFTWAALKITIPESGLRLRVHRTRQQCQSWLQRLGEKERHGGGLGCEPECAVFISSSFFFWTGREMLNQLESWGVFMKWVHVMMTEAHWAMILLHKSTIKFSGIDCVHVRQWLICLFWGYWSRNLAVPARDAMELDLILFHCHWCFPSFPADASV